MSGCLCVLSSIGSSYACARVNTRNCSACARVWRARVRPCPLALECASARALACLCGANAPVLCSLAARMRSHSVCAGALMQIDIVLAQRTHAHAYMHVRIWPHAFACALSGNTDKGPTCAQSTLLALSAGQSPLRSDEP
eukprot:242232-Pleurochrysis_carterae.AAC.1